MKTMLAIFPPVICNTVKCGRRLLEKRRLRVMNEGVRVFWGAISAAFAHFQSRATSWPFCKERLVVGSIVPDKQGSNGKAECPVSDEEFPFLSGVCFGEYCRELNPGERGPAGQEDGWVLPKGDLAECVIIILLSINQGLNLAPSYCLKSVGLGIRLKGTALPLF